MNARPERIAQLETGFRGFDAVAGLPRDRAPRFSGVASAFAAARERGEETLFVGFDEAADPLTLPLRRADAGSSPPPPPKGDDAPEAGK